MTEENTPSTAEPDSEEEGDRCNTASSSSSKMTEECSDQAPAPRQLQAGLFDDDCSQGPPPSSTVPKTMEPAATSASSAQNMSGGGCSRSSGQSSASPAPCAGSPQEDKFSADETLFIFDWDDTILPSTWVQRQGLRLDAASHPTVEQRDILAEVAVFAGKTLRAARQHGTVVLVTNAERGWIELSCQKFLPALAPMLENVKLVSARTTFECPQCRSPLDWKLRAFDAEIALFYGSETVLDPSKRKNVFSLGDSVHEREALLRATSSAPNCHSKSLKFVERPEVSQICKQHELITNCFERIVHHNGNLDMCIRCP